MTSFICARTHITSDAGSPYRCGRVGRGIQPPSTPSPTPLFLTNTDSHNGSLENARFRNFQLDHHDGPTDGPTDRRTKPRILVASYPQLKMFARNSSQTGTQNVVRTFHELEKAMIKWFNIMNEKKSSQWSHGARESP